MTAVQEIAETFNVYNDRGVAVVSRVEEFAILRQGGNGIGAVTMPNPVELPEDPEELAAFMAAMKKYNEGSPKEWASIELIQAEPPGLIQGLPRCIEDTAKLLSEAFRHASDSPLTSIDVRKNTGPRPDEDPHRDEVIAGSADIFGSTTVFYEGGRERPGRSYSLPRHHITIFRFIPHSAGDVHPGVLRLTMLCG